MSLKSDRYAFRVVKQKVEQPDGTVKEITVVERRLKKNHDKMMARIRRDEAHRRRMGELKEIAAADAEAGDDAGDVSETGDAAETPETETVATDAETGGEDLSDDTLELDLGNDEDVELLGS